MLVAGGLAVGTAADDHAFVGELADLAARSEEVGSVCTGALLLAEAGLLDGRSATTRWALADLLADAHPSVDVDADRIYLHDGIWSSAGVTAGIDLALQLLRTHHGGDIAAQAAATSSSTSSGRAASSSTAHTSPRSGRPTRRSMTCSRTSPTTPTPTCLCTRSPSASP